MKLRESLKELLLFCGQGLFYTGLGLLLTLMLIGLLLLYGVITGEDKLVP